MYTIYNILKLQLSYLANKSVKILNELLTSLQEEIW